MYAKLNAKQQAKASAASRLAGVYNIQATLDAWGKSDLRCYQPGGAVFARAILEYPGEFARWEFHPASGEEGVFTIRNVGLGLFIVANEEGALTVDASPGLKAAEFRVQPAGDGFVQIKQRDADRVWSLRGNPLYSEVFLEAANGSYKQKFSQVASDD